MVVVANLVLPDRRAEQMDLKADREVCEWIRDTIGLVDDLPPILLTSPTVSMIQETESLLSPNSKAQW